MTREIFVAGKKKENSPKSAQWPFARIPQRARTTKSSPISIYKCFNYFNVVRGVNFKQMIFINFFLPGNM